jgi:creatinine amidohydrolase
MLLSKMKWPEVRREIEEGVVVIIPVGSTEQHGHHLPLDTDAAIVSYVAREAARKAGAIVAPPVNYGYNEKELAFPGTVSIKAQTFIDMMFDICHSLSRTGFRRILLLNGHGFNTFLLTTVSHMVNEHCPALCASASYWDLVDRDLLQDLRESKTPGGMSHAGEFETSVQLALDPGHVEMDKAVKEMSFQETEYTFFDLVEKPPVVIRTHWDKNSRSGVVGDPTLATKEKGEQLIASAVDGLVGFLRLFREEITH